MKKLVFVIILIAMIGMGVMPAAAIEPDAVTALATYYPKDTVVFTSIRTDDEALSRLESILVTLGAVLPDEILDISPDFAIGELEIAPDATFEMVIRPWLGDSIAFGVTEPAASLMTLEPNEIPAFLVAAEITDREFAEGFVTQFLREAVGETPESEEIGAYEIWTVALDQDLSVHVALSDDVLLISTSEDGLYLDGLNSTLADNERFQATIGLLPAEFYGVTAYGDLGAFNDATLALIPEEDAAQMPTELIEAFTALNSGGAIGLTTIDDIHLAIDLVSAIDDTGPLNDIGIFLDYPTEPIDLEFASAIPEDAPLVVHGNNLGPNILFGAENLRALIDFFIERSDIELEPRTLDRIFRAIAFTFEQFAGFSLEDDILERLDGDFGLFLRTVPLDTGSLSLDIAGVFEIGDTRSALSLIDTIDATLTEYNADFTREDDTLIFSVDALPETDFLVGTNGDVIGVGNRPGVSFALNPDESNLAAFPAFERAQTAFVPETELLLFLNLQPALSILDDGLDNQPQFASLIDLLGLIDSASISQRSGEDGSIGRMVLSLSEETVAAMMEADTPDETADEAAETSEEPATDADADAEIVPFGTEVGALLPEGWEEVEPGTFAGPDEVTLVVVDIPAPSNFVLPGIAQEAGLDDTPEQIGTIETGDLEWRLFLSTIEGAPTEFAVTGVGPTRSLLVMLINMPEDSEELVDSVFIPVLESAAE